MKFELSAAGAAVVGGGVVGVVVLVDVVVLAVVVDDSSVVVEGDSFALGFEPLQPVVITAAIVSAAMRTMDLRMVCTLHW